MAAELLGLFAAFPSQALSDATAEARARHYLAAIAGFPVATLRQAIGLWMRGDHPGAHDNHAFPPSPPQLVRLCRIALAPVQARIAMLEALSRSEAAPLPPGAAEAARVEALAAAFRVGRKRTEKGHAEERGDTPEAQPTDRPEPEPEKEQP